MTTFSLERSEEKGLRERKNQKSAPKRQRQHPLVDASALQVVDDVFHASKGEGDIFFRRNGTLTRVRLKKRDKKRFKSFIRERKRDRERGKRETWIWLHSFTFVFSHCWLWWWCVCKGWREGRGVRGRVDGRGRGRGDKIPFTISRSLSLTRTFMLV